MLNGHMVRAQRQGGQLAGVRLTPEEEAAWRAKDPIERVRTYLLGRGAIDQAWLDELDAEAEALGVRVREGALALPEPKRERDAKLARFRITPTLAGTSAGLLATGTF